jgi:hypothetical protein
MTDEVYCNRQRTSTRSGILKSEAVLHFSQVLQHHGVEYLQDVEPIIGDPNFEIDIRQIPGQRSGISLRSFYMLAGADDFIKQDRMIHRFLYAALGRNLTIEECHHAIIGAHSLLVQDYPALTPKSLDHLIWRYERSK